jgi:hypothetical protein
MYLKEYLNKKIDLYYGRIFISDFWSLVPRSLYPNKPFAYGVVLINEYFFPGAAELTNTPAFGGPIAYFADFGIIGVILFTLFNPIIIIRSLLYIKLVKNINLKSVMNNNLYFLLFILFYSPYLFMLIAFPINIFLTFIILIIIVIYSVFYKKTFINEGTCWHCRVCADADDTKSRRVKNAEGMIFIFIQCVLFIDLPQDLSKHSSFGLRRRNDS